ncbi:hypothetical protein N7468_004900 [Penicillium chermesinum]|uniref:Enoyl reductase (ER) domain-containing protein n=1 Tax=Penicillium chermesinum TaxID=63820 RepID=A0A9W9PA30_9EURO|nr:uncharacterized protein N7468_004900 [Penicillium chermesinum]KAJ5240281.1 hypothetical protein N7468_004900 [Penicillium chermesinum]
MASYHPEAMKAWLYSSAYGGIENNMQLHERARVPPVPQGTEVLVQVLSAALNPLDFKFPEIGMIMARMVTGASASPGLDFCGRVVATGPLARHLKEGQLALCSPPRFGSLGDYLTITADKIAVAADGVAVDSAAAIPLAGQTAYQSLEGYVKAGDKVFINGGSGGCGIFAIQIAKQMGCHVTATCSTRNVELCFRLGVDEVINYTTETDLVATLGQRGVVFDHIVDHIGVPSDLYYQCHRFLKEGGVFIQVGASSLVTFVSRLSWPSILGGGQRKYTIMMVKNNQRQLQQLMEWLASGAIQVQLDSTYEFRDAVKAFQRLKSGRTRGKIIVHVNDPHEQNMEPFGIGL